MSGVAGSNFGNKEDITVTMFTPGMPTDPVRPDINSEGKIFDKVLVAASATITSKSVKVIAHPGHYPTKTIYVESDKAGTFIVQVMLDESELVTGAPVWRTMTTPIAVASGILSKWTGIELFRQVRIKFTADSGISGNATVSSWLFSVA
jgi:hypothetical protein